MACSYVNHKINILKLPGGFLFFSLLLSALFLFPAHAYAKGINVNDAKYSTILFDSGSGLPTSEASAIAQTSDGFIWIGSYSGLIRYSGNEFTRYGLDAGITSVLTLYADDSNRLFIGTDGSGAAVYENGEFVFYKDGGLESRSVYAIAEDDKHNIILATSEGISYIDAENNVHALHDERTDSEQITMLNSDKDGAVYGITKSGSLFTIEALKLTYYKKDFNGAAISCVCPDSSNKGNVYLGTSDAEIIYGSISDDLVSVKKYPANSLTKVNMILNDDLNLWICADNGIGYIDNNKSFHALSNCPLTNSVNFMMEDYEGNLWFTSQRQGVMELTVSPFVDISGLAGLDNRVVNSTCIYEDDLYIGTDTGLIILDKDYVQKQNNLTARFDGTKINCIMGDTDGNIWFCTEGENALSCFDGEVFVSFNEDTGLPANNVRTICELSDGTVAAASGSSVCIIKDREHVNAYDTGADASILSLCDGGDGRLYIGTGGDGIFILEKGKISQLDTGNGLNSDVILKIKKDPYENLFWIITSISVSYMEDGKINTVTDFPYSNNYDVYFSKNGELWVLSSNGIYVVSRDDMLSGDEPDYRFYNSLNGLKSMTTADSYSFIDEDGTLYIAGTTGVCSICIDEAEMTANDIRLAIPYIETDDKMIAVKDGERITIPSDTKRLTIYCYALTFTLDNPQVSYMLEGFDDEEVFTTVRDLGPTTYTNLVGGEYVFTLSAYNNQTGQKDKTAVLITYKEKQLYEQPLFWVIAVILLLVIIASLGYLYFRYRTSSMVKKQEEMNVYMNQVISAFAKTIDIKDKYTNGHSFRVAQYSKMIAEKMHYSEDELDKIYHIALLHDVGKITVPDEILRKPGKLTDEEFATIKQHAVNGYNILKEIEISPELALGAGFHHERIDGKGYPSGLKGDEIPMIAQIIAVADMFDAMNSTRPYRKRVKMEEIEEELKRVSGTQLNPDIVKVLLKLIDEYAFEK